MEKRELFLKFKEKAIQKHKGKYTYEDENYIDSKHYIKITCPIHGVFQQTPQAHLRGNGCPLCANAKRGKQRLTNSEFIHRLKTIYGDLYDYSKVEYANMNTPVNLICRKHGLFSKAPLSLLRKQGCPKCNRRNLTTTEIIELFREIHGDKYDYSKVVYKHMNNKVCIICPIHGEFWQTPLKHLKGRGCNNCGIISRIKKSILPQEKVIERMNSKHNNKYDYSLVKYKNMQTKIEIICPKHGAFYQRPYDHLNGHGCPYCIESKLEEEIKNFLNENNIEFEQQKRFEWLGKQSLDFYLPQNNIAIECQGKQHFESVEKFGGNGGLKVTLERDERKRKLCEENGIRLLYYSNLGIKYPYKVYENLQELIENIKNNHKSNPL